MAPPDQFEPSSTGSPPSASFGLKNHAPPQGRAGGLMRSPFVRSSRFLTPKFRTIVGRMIHPRYPSSSPPADGESFPSALERSPACRLTIPAARAPGDLRQVKAFQIVEAEHLRILRVQLVELPSYRSLELAQLGLPVGRGLVRREGIAPDLRRGGAFSKMEFEALVTAFANQPQRVIVRDPEEPLPEPFGAPEIAYLEIRLDKDVLRDIERVLAMPRHTLGGDQYQRVIPVDQGREGRTVALAYPRDKMGVLIFRHGPGAGLHRVSDLRTSADRPAARSLPH